MLQVVVYDARGACCEVVGLLDAEDIDKWPLIFVELTAPMLLACIALTFAELREEVDVVYIGRHRVVDVLLALIVAHNLIEAFEVLAQHNDIDIVVPGYESLVTCRAEQRARA